MSELIPALPPRSGADPEHSSSLDPRLEREDVRHRWEVRAAQWRALDLARTIFGSDTRARLVGGAPGQAFRGLLRLEVPFRELDDHRWREGLFLAWAAEDPVLSRVPFVFVFDPRPVPAAP